MELQWVIKGLWVLLAIIILFKLDAVIRIDQHLFNKKGLRISLKKVDDLQQKVITKKQLKSKYSRGDIVIANLGYFKPSHKQHGTRPVIIVSNNLANAYSSIVTVVPLTSKVNKKPDLPTHVLINFEESGLQKNSIAMAEQVSSIDKYKLHKKVGHVDDIVMKRVTKALNVQIGVYAQYN